MTTFVSNTKISASNFNPYVDPVTNENSVSLNLFLKVESTEGVENLQIENINIFIKNVPDANIFFPNKNFKITFETIE